MSAAKPTTSAQGRRLVGSPSRLPAACVRQVASRRRAGNYRLPRRPRRTTLLLVWVWQACQACMGRIDSGAGSYAATAGVGQVASVQSISPTGPAEAASDSPPADPSAPLPAAGNLLFLGRTLNLDPNSPDHVALSWAGVAASARFEGTAITAHFVDSQLPAPRATTTGLLPAVRTNYYKVYVDGVLTQQFGVDHNAAQDVLLASGLGPGPHTLTLVKRTEAWIGINGLAGLSLAEGGSFLAPPPRPSRCIEILGASVDTAYGVLGADCHPQLSPCQDVEKSWGNQAGEAVGAEVVNLSYSGHGMEWSNAGPYPPGYSPADYYLETDITAVGHPWDANARQVDAVLFGLFANDWFFLGGNTAPPKAKFEGELTAIIATIRRLHPEAHVYLTISSSMETNTRPGLTLYLQDVVAAAQAGGDMRVHMVAFDAALGLGCDAHPDIGQQTAMATTFIPILKRDLGW